ncbi:MAG: TatD family hydrolase, partial [Clostridia bacterium]|nr:TatD family hydrolase [Clostridia bacterium]
MDIFDTHAHLLDEHFDEDREALIASLADAGVKLVMEACTDLKYLEKLIPFVEAWPMLYGAAGLHPEELGPYTLSDLTAVEAALDH